MTKKQEDFYIEVLKWAKEKGTFTYNEIDNQFNLDKDSIKHDLIHKYWSERLFCELCINREMKSHISYDAYFNLLQHQELEEARQASLDANKNAKIAICFSIAVMILTVVFSVLQIFYPTKLNQEQIDKLTHPTATINQKQIEDITNNKFRFDDEQLKSLTSGPIKLDQEQLEIIKGWIDQSTQRENPKTK